MRPAIILNAQNKAVSVLVSWFEISALSVGTKVELVKDFETPYGKISAGTKGFVDYVDPETGTIWLLMEGIEPALIHWDNMLVLMPFDTEDILDCLVFTPTRQLQFLHVASCANTTQSEACVTLTT
jgi:hypothetical protein